MQVASLRFFFTHRGWEGRVIKVVGGRVFVGKGLAGEEVAFGMRCTMDCETCGRYYQWTLKGLSAKKAGFTWKILVVRILRRLLHWCIYHRSKYTASNKHRPPSPDSCSNPKQSRQVISHQISPVSFQLDLPEQ